jgi:phage portal protein BeeE
MHSTKEALSNIAGASAELQFTKIGLNTDELKPFEYLGWDEKQICNVLGWDNVLLNDKTRATDNNVEQAEQRVIVNTIMPSLQLLQEALNNRFLPLFKGYENTVFEFDYSDLPEMQQDMAKLVGWVVQLINVGVLNRDESREYVGMPCLDTEEMLAYTVNQDVIPLAEAINDEFNEPTELPA